MARGALQTEHIEALVTELSALGPDYESRRAAAVAGLAIARHLERFATATDHQGKPLTVSTTRMSIRADDRYLQRFLAQWGELVRVLGDETQVLQRLEMTADGVLPVIDPSHPNAQRVFKLLMQMVPSSPHLSKHITISAQARFAPGGKPTRDLVLAALTRFPVQYWETLVAGEIFAEQFADDPELRRQVVQHALRAPHGIGEAALADLLLRHPDPDLERSLREKATGAQYDVATHFKLVAALSGPRAVVQALENLLARDLSGIHDWHLPRWVPAVIRRIEKDPDVQDLLHAALRFTASSSVRASFVSLLARAAGVDERLRSFIGWELDRTGSEAMPEVGFDVSSESYRLVRHVLIETIG